MLQQLLSQIAPRRFFETVLGRSLPDENARGDVRLNCCFHKDRTGRDDDTSSLSINVAKDGSGMFRCFGCDVAGNLISFYREYRKTFGIMVGDHRVQGDADLRTIAKELIQIFELDSDTFDKAVIDDARLTEYQNNLYNTSDGKKLLKHIKEHRCITDTVIRDFRLGYSEEYKRLAIPIFDADNEVVNVRYWLPEYGRKTKEDHANKIFGIGGANRPRLYPYTQLRNQDIIICEGELDALVLIGMGLNALTTTGGVEGFSKQWITFFEGKNITIIQDNDPAGQKGMDDLLLLLYPVAKTVKQVVLGDKGDVTDWARDGGATAGQAFREIIKNTPAFYIQDEEHIHYDQVNIHSAANADKINKRISLTALVAGKEEQVYAVPRVVQLTCTSDNTKGCPGCPRNMFDRDTRELTIEPDDPIILEILGSRAGAESALKKAFGIRCKTPMFETLEYQNVEVIHMIPATDRNTTEVYEYTNRVAYHVGTQARVRMNNKYKMLGRTVLDPDHRVTHLFTDVEVQDKLAKNLRPEDKVFVDGVEGEVRHFLTQFQVSGDQTVAEKLNEIYTDLEKHVTRIINRRDITQAYDMVYHSPLSFMFQDRPKEEGWMSCLVIGDTQCGKSETLYKLQKHYRLGECYSGESITRAGIIGAYAEIPGRRGTQFRLGVAPLNDGGLIGIDEAGGMSEEQFDELTMLRSTGEAMSTKYGQHNRFPARVRMIMVSNPRKGKPMHYFAHGCLAVKELIGGDADVARFDIFVAVGSDEVKIDQINQAWTVIGDPVYTSDLCNLLLQWVWTRRASDYKFTEDAVKLVFEVSNEMSEQYDQSIPIVAHGSHRWTIAKCAASLAARLYSTSTGQDVIVTADHVEAAASFLYETYNKPLMGYGIWSARNKANETVKDEGKLKELCDSMPYNLFDAIVNLSRYTPRELDADTAVGDHTIRDYVARLRTLRALKHSGGYFYKTKGFIKWMEYSGYKHPDADSFVNDFLYGEQTTEGSESEID